jgi:hypothetical protein
MVSTIQQLNARIDSLESQIQSLLSSKLHVKPLASGFNLFAKTFRPHIRSSLSFHSTHTPLNIHVMKEIALTWNLLLPEEKNHWNLRAASFAF